MQGLTELLAGWHDWLRALHIISVIAWMAGLFYLPRLFVYHAEARDGGKTELMQTFMVMERRLYRGIMWPAMIASWLFGLLLIAVIGLAHGWLHVKLLMVVLLSAFHLWMGRYRKRFAQQQEQASSRYFRMVNEIPTVLMIIIVIMAVVKPF